MSKYYIAVTEQDENGKNYAYAIPITSSDNILCKLENRNFLHANIFITRKETEKVVKFWNESYKNNGTYMFD